MSHASTEKKSIKGFDKNLACRGYQFAIGQTFEQAGKVRACETGFHACDAEQHPFEVFGYYPPAGSRYCDVVQSGEMHSDDGIKIASAKITIGVEIGLHGLIARGLEFVFSRATNKAASSHATGEKELASSTGDYGAASSTGNRGAASSTGYQGAASSTGDYGAASSTGNRGAASSTGNRGAASSTGDYGAASSTGNRGAASSTGDYGAASSTGDYGAASSTGYQGAASSTGNRGAASSTGYQGAAKAANGSAAMTNGYAGRVMGETAGCPLYAAERDENYNLLSVACGITGQDGIAVGVWYVCKAGKLVEAASC
jgi:hypothetical protein